jgi:hypothetical protein
MSTQFDYVGMPELSLSTSISKGIRNDNDGNPKGDVVDNTAGKNLVAARAQSLSTNQGDSLQMQSKPSTL